LIALLSFREGVDPDEFLSAYVASPELAADIQGLTSATSSTSRNCCSIRSLDLPWPESAIHVACR